MTELLTSPKEIPDGFTVSEDPSGRRVITYRSKGMGCLLWFLGISVLGLGGGTIIFAVNNPSGFRQFVMESWLSIICGSAGFIALICCIRFVLFHLFGYTMFCIEPKGLTVAKSLFGLRWSKNIPREKMEYLEQIKDGGEDEDSFPGWGLVLKAKGRYKLLNRQRIEKSDWLGSLISEFFGLEYRPCQKRS